jgi:hypothetical protein
MRHPSCRLVTIRRPTPPARTNNVSAPCSPQQTQNASRRRLRGHARVLNSAVAGDLLWNHGRRDPRCLMASRPSRRRLAVPHKARTETKGTLSSLHRVTFGMAGQCGLSGQAIRTVVVRALAHRAVPAPRPSGGGGGERRVRGWAHRGLGTERGPTRARQAIARAC